MNSESELNSELRGHFEAMGGPDIARLSQELMDSPELSGAEFAEVRKKLEMIASIGHDVQL